MGTLRALSPLQLYSLQLDVVDFVPVESLINFCSCCLSRLFSFLNAPWRGTLCVSQTLHAFSPLQLHSWMWLISNLWNCQSFLQALLLESLFFFDRALGRDIH